MELKTSFVGLAILTAIFLIYICSKAIDKTSSSPKRDKNILVFSLLIWHLFIYILSSTDLLKSYDFPPRFALAFIIPSFIFTGIFLFRNRRKKWIKSIPEHWIIYFQTFRVLVETLFVYALAEGIFNYQVTIEGYNYDMIFALTAPFVAFLVYQKKILSRKIVFYWNFLGLLVLISVIFLFLASMYKPEFFGSELPILPLQSMSYPYVLIAGFLMPTAVFLHLLSIVQLKSRIQNSV